MRLVLWGGLACFLALCALAAVTMAANTRDGSRRNARGGAGTSGLKQLDVRTGYGSAREVFPCIRVKRCDVGLFKLVGRASGGPVTVSLSTHLAGAVYKLTYADTEFVNPVPIVGASMQTALVFDGRGEYNPTEAGNGELDSGTGKSSSKMLELWASDTAVYTVTQPAYFLKPGVGTTKHKTVVSDVIFSKRIEFVDDGVLDFTVSVDVPGGKYYFSLIEVLATWVPIVACKQLLVFEARSWKPMVLDVLYWRKATRTSPASSGIVMANETGTRAMGVVLLEWPREPPWETPRYSSPDANARNAWKKWSVTQRIGLPNETDFRIPKGTWTWKTRMFFGGIDHVKRSVEKAT